MNIIVSIAETAAVGAVQQRWHQECVESTHIDTSVEMILEQQLIRRNIETL